MELFQENKNVLFQKTVELINDMVKAEQGYTEEEIRDYLENVINQECSNEVRGPVKDKIDDLIYGSKNDSSLEQNSSLIWGSEEGLYEPKLKMKIPYIPTKIENSILAELIQDPIAKNFLSQTLREKIDNSLDVKAKPDIYLHKNQRDTKKQYEEQKDLYNTLSIIIKAILDEKMIEYDNHTRNGILTGKIGTPYRFVYSSRLNRIQLIIKPEKEERGVLVNLDGLKNIHILDKSGEACLETWLEKQKSEFTIKIINKEKYTKEKHNNIVERCFSMFSHLDKEAVYNEEANTHTMKVRYYKFDEEDIIRDILIMGSDIVVLEPVELREKIIAKLI